MNMDSNFIYRVRYQMEVSMSINKEYLFFYKICLFFRFIKKKTRQRQVDIEITIYGKRHNQINQAAIQFDWRQ